MGVISFLYRIKNRYKFVWKLLYPIRYVYARIYNNAVNRQMRKNLHASGIDVLTFFKDCLDKQGIKFWLTSGTLLGAWREKSFIGHDMDIDVCVFAEHRDEAKKILQENGFELLHEYGVVGSGVKEHAYELNGVKIDVFYVEKEEDKFSVYVFFKEKAEQTDFNVIKILYPETGFVPYSFMYGEFLIPEKTIEYLVANYGENFMIPDKNWKYTKDIPSAIYYPLSEKQGFTVSYENNQ